MRRYEAGEPAVSAPLRQSTDRLAVDEDFTRPFDGYEPFYSLGAPAHRSRLARRHCRMTTVHRRVGHQIAHITFNVDSRNSSLDCTCSTFLDAPTPELLDLEWQAHRREVRAGEARPLGKVPGYTFGGAFK